ncbi:LysR family transcriptional regulator [Sphingomonas sp. AR_OL41]|uniref:LysR family transcriptional regulator n=1 Tax=Sphingomonas sp. AR_OL41 TaxID=3042729 RepID=UPI00247FE88C|nr:LysR family transcriptional regulator [Sphingomonas sp. AR_OL41]MDH7973880.1 LysR family transcriptional regulator [Sphingomonas sp. AR_OL41]
MDKLAALSTFAQAAELRSFTAAGRAIGVSSSAVGKTIMRMEERLGVRLFNRSTRSITLTAEGEALFRRCRRIFAEVEAAELELAQSQGMPRGKLKISLPLVGTLLTPALANFSRAYPEIELDLDFSDRLVDIIEEGFDVVLRTGTATDSQLKTRILGNFSFVIVGSPGYFAEHAIPETPEDLLRHACLRHRWSSSGKLESWRLQRDDTFVDIELPATVVTNTIEPLISLAEGGAGLTCVPIFAVRRQLAAGTLRPVLDQYLKDVSAFRMLWPAGLKETPKQRAFVDFMTKHLFSDLKGA